MGKIIWAKNTYLQDENGLWYRPGFDYETTCRHLLVSVQREGLDRGSSQEERFAHIHFWQLETNSDKLGFNVVFFGKDSEKDSAYRDRNHVYGRDTVYGASESIFFTPEMQVRISTAIRNEEWFSRNIFSESIGGIRREGILKTLESTHRPNEVAIKPIGFTPTIRRGTPFKADPMALREVVLKLKNYHQQIKHYLEEMDTQVNVAITQSNESDEFEFMLKQQYQWQEEYQKVNDFLDALLLIADYVDRKANETDEIP